MLSGTQDAFNTVRPSAFVLEFTIESLEMDGWNMVYFINASIFPMDNAMVMVERQTDRWCM